MDKEYKTLNDAYFGIQDEMRKFTADFLDFVNADDNERKAIWDLYNENDD